MITEREYLRKIGTAHRKKYAQFFTPEPIAAFMTEWVMQGRKGCAHILEPAFGLGVFSRALFQLHPDTSVTGYDIDETIFNYAKANFVAKDYSLQLRNEDYLDSSWEEHFDGVVCNPPYLKFHDYNNGRYVPIVNNHLNTRLNGFTNIYTLFLLKSIAQLNESGRLAYIVPSEFLNADYGVEVKRALLASGTLRHIIIVDFTESAFDDAITTACILLCQNSDDENQIRFSKINHIEELPSALTNYQIYPAVRLNPEVKWKQYYEECKTRQYCHLVPFSTFAKVSRGIATGANDYFTFNEEKKAYYNLADSCFLPCIAHSTDVKSQIFTLSDFEKLSAAGRNVYLFDGCADETNPHVKSYIRLGEETGKNKRFLTASRSPWFSLENRKPSPIWVSVFNRSGLRFVRNEAGVSNLTTFHCVYNISEIDTNVLFAYLVTGLAKEIFLENSRQYGNGLIKFEPNDLNRGQVVDLRLLTTDECAFISEVYELMHYFGSLNERCTNLLDEFFREKYTTDDVQLSYYTDALRQIKAGRIESIPAKVRSPRIKQLNIFDLIEKYADAPIVENALAESEPEYGLRYDRSKNVLISLVKDDNKEVFENRTAHIYYTGKKFPASVELNRLYYFMPYIKRKGIRDLYLIKIARVGSRKEGQPDNNPNDLRLVFEIEFVKKFFNDYKPIELEIWHTFTDTKFGELMERF